MERSNSITVYRNGAQVPAQRPQALPIVATPVADILETDTAFFIRIDLPGASRDSIRVSVQRGVLAITADLREPDVAPRRPDGACAEGGRLPSEGDPRALTARGPPIAIYQSSSFVVQSSIFNLPFSIYNV